jgi:hypothetical protein
VRGKEREKGERKRWERKKGDENQERGIERKYKRKYFKA